MKTFEPTHARNNATIQYCVGGRIDARTFNATTTWSNRTHGSRKEVTIRLYEDHEEAEHVARVLQAVNNPNIAKFLFMDTEQLYPIIVFERFHARFDDLLQRVEELPIWEYDDDVTKVVSMGIAFHTPFKGIIDGIRALHYAKLYHGDLRNGVTVSNSLHTVKLVNVENSRGDFKLGMLKDLEDLRDMVREVTTRHPPRNSLKYPAVDLFFQLKDLFPDLGLDGSLRTYAYFLYHDPLFYDGDDRYTVTEKLWEFRQLNCDYFDAKVTLEGQHTSMRDWGMRIPSDSLLMSLWNNKSTKRKYKRARGVFSLFRNSYPHLQEDVPGHHDSATERILNNIFPDVIPKLYYEFVEKIASKTDIYEGYEIINFFREVSPIFP